MKIDDIDLLKQWLVNVLNPIFDGDPEKLALYIVALAKKVEDDRASRDRCINDLEVFLETNTHKFVDTLFETLISKKYLASGGGGVAISSQDVAGNDQPQHSNNNIDSSNTNTINRSNTNEESSYINSNRRYNDTNNGRYHNDSRDPRDQRSRRFNNYEDQQQQGVNRQRYENSSRGGNNFNKSRLGSDRETGRAASGRERHKNRSRNRTHRGADSTSSSSSSSPEASSRRFDGERSKHGYRRSRSRSSRSRSNSPRNGDNNVNRKKRCRDFDEKGICTLAEYCPYDHGEVVIAPVLSNPPKQQTSIAPDADAKQHINQPQNYPGNMSQQQQGPYNPSNSNEMYQQHHMNYQRGGMRGGMNQMRGGMMRRNPNMIPGNMPFPNQVPPGMQGGMDQPRFTNQNMPGGNQMDFNAQQDFQQRQMLGNRQRNLVNIPTSIHQNEEMMGNNPHMQSEFSHQRGQKRSYTNLNAPVNDSIIPYVNPSLLNAPPQDFNNQKSLLPNPPIMPNQQQQQQHQQTPTPHQQSFNKQPHFNLNQPPPSGPHTSSMNSNPPTSAVNVNQPHQINSTLVLRKVPTDLNRADVIRQHFTKFGQLIDIQCKYDGHNDAALIRFANNQQAFAAFKSPESILNNRFIRIHWFNHYQKSQNFNIQGQQQLQQASSHDEPQSDEPSQKRLATLQIQQQDFIKNKENKHQTPMSAESGPLTKTAEAASSSNQSDLNIENNPKSEDATSMSFKQEAGISSSLHEAPGIQGMLTTNFNTLTLKQTKAISAESHKKIAALKLQVKQKARELIEQQIKDQKLLLKKFEQAKTVEEKSQILSLVKKLNESIEKEKEILNSKIHGENQASDFSHSPFSFQKNPSQMSAQAVVPKNLPPAHSLKLNNMRYNQSNFLKSQQLAQANAAKSISQSPKPVGSPKSTPPAFTFPKAAVDNRPKKLIITGVENSQEKEAILNFVNAIGCQVESATEEAKNEATNLFSFVISFCTRKDAEIALAKCSSSLTSKTISITWFRSETNVPKTTVPEDSKAISKAEDTRENTAITEGSNNDEQAESQSKEELKPSDDENLLSEIDNLLDEDKSSSTNADIIGNAEETPEIEQNKEEKDVVDALFDDSANYETETILS